jgi:hypothetical protein
MALAGCNLELYYDARTYENQTWKVFKQCGQDGVGIRPVRVYDTPVTGCAKTFITDIIAAVPAPNILVA